MGDLLQPWHLILLAIVAFLLFGVKRLPELGKGLGEGLKGFERRHQGRDRSRCSSYTAKHADTTSATAGEQRASEQV